MNDPGTLHVFTPTYRPAGGVVKLMDYVTHALEAGYQVSVRGPQAWSADLPLFRSERLAPLVGNPRVRFSYDEPLAVRSRDLVLVSFPDQYEDAYRSLPSGMSPERVIHLIQGVRHANPAWRDGYPFRLLTRPVARISVNSVIGDVIEKWLDPRAMHEVIPIGHDVDFFALDRSGPLATPIKVAYTTWKSEVGDAVAAQLAPDQFEFRAIRDTADWSELRRLYHWADVFLATTGPEEGVYLPGIEALAAGCLLVTPDVGGNMAYCRPGANCLLVGYEAPDDYVRALLRIRDMGPDSVQTMRRAGHEGLRSFSLSSERAAFHLFLERLWPRIEIFESGRAA